MHYNIESGAEKYFFLLKKIIHCGNGYGAGIPKPVRDGDEIRFLIPVEYG